VPSLIAWARLTYCGAGFLLPRLDRARTVVLFGVRSNHALERAGAGSFGEATRVSMMWIKCLRLTSPMPLAAQLHR
jgi:hypothetical protein